jgi:hypothetical protein
MTSQPGERSLTEAQIGEPLPVRHAGAGVASTKTTKSCFRFPRSVGTVEQLHRPSTQDEGPLIRAISMMAMQSVKRFTKTTVLANFAKQL